jgi:multiple antibiotic resistance protein
VALPAILIVVDPIACAPIYILLTAGETPAEKRRIARRAAVTTGIVLVLFALVGGAVFSLFGVTLGAFRAAGGAVLFLSALEMMQGRTFDAPASVSIRHADVAVLPIAIPILAGPGAFSAVAALMAHHTGPGALGVLIAIALSAFAAWLVLRGAEWIERSVPAVFLSALARVTGLILAAIAVEFVVAGIRDVALGRT